MPQSFSQILYTVEDRVATITLNRPEKLNAFTETMRQELIAAFDAADADDDVRAVIVTGAGRAFCAGADLSAGGKTFDMDAREDRESPGAGQHWRDGGGTVSLRIFECRKPVIAAINGPAVGVGVTMTLPMDIRLASTEARFGLVFSRRGLVPEACSSWFLPRVVGISRALEWVYSGRVFPAQEALEGGLVRQLCAPEDLLPRAREIAAEIADNTAPVAIAVARQMLWRMLGADHPMEAHKVDSRGIFNLGRSPDAYEGVQFFLEKRKPAFGMSPATDMPAFVPWWTEREFE
ncbi:MAG: crotonase/enoyl-CoA hydratase family protein [Sneathiellaceae bacterium]